MDAKIKELYNKHYCRYEYGEVLTTHSFKLVQITASEFKLYVCDAMDSFAIYTYDIEGNLLSEEEKHYGNPDSMPVGEPLEHFPTSDER